MSGKISGIARIKVNAELLESLPGAELDIGGVERTLHSGHRVYGPSEKIMPSMLTCTIVWKFATPIENLRNLVDGLITFESDNGVTYSMPNACCLKTLKLTDDKGEIKLEFGGDPAEPQ